MVRVLSPAIAILFYTTSADNSYLTSYPQPSRPPWYLHQDTPSSLHQGHTYNNYINQTTPSKPLFVLQLCPIPLSPWPCINSPGHIYWSRRAVSPSAYVSIRRRALGAVWSCKQRTYAHHDCCSLRARLIHQKRGKGRGLTSERQGAVGSTYKIKPWQ